MQEFEANFVSMNLKLSLLIGLSYPHDAARAYFLKRIAFCRKVKKGLKQTGYRNI